MHFVAALDDVPAMRGVLLPLRGRGHRRGRRLRAGGRAAGGHAAAPRPRTRQRAGQPPQRPARPDARSSTSWATTPRTTPATTRRSQSDIASIAGPVSGWYRSTARADDVAGDAADAVAAALGSAGLRGHAGPAGGRVVVGVEHRSRARRGRGGGRPWCPPTPSRRWPRRCVRASGRRCCSAAAALRADGLQAASRVAATTGAALLGETFPANLERGAGIPAVERLAYLAEMAQAQLDGVRHLVLVDAKSPVSFFAYPDKASDLVPAGCTVHTLARPGEDAAAALEALAEAVGAPATSRGAGALGPARRDPPAPSRPSRWPPPWAPRCPRAPSWSTRATRRASSSRRRRRGRRATTG